MTEEGGEYGIITVFYSGENAARIRRIMRENAAIPSSWLTHGDIYDHLKIRLYLPFSY